MNEQRKPYAIETWTGREWLRLPDRYRTSADADVIVRNGSGGMRVVYEQKPRKSYARA